jgi:hypothetical protein
MRTSLFIKYNIMRVINAILKRLYYPLCRIYARLMGDKPADAFLRLLCSIPFREAYGFWPNFKMPMRFSEKIWSRQLHERDGRLTLVSDKLLVRDFVGGIVGNRYLVPLLWQGTDPEEIPFDDLPAQFVLKANHGCAYNIIVRAKPQLDRMQTKRQLRRWLAENFGETHGLGIAWAYKNIRPHILVEQFLSEAGHVPVDYKFFCFSGRMEYFKIDFDRFEDHATRFFDRELNPLELVEVGLKMYRNEIQLPTNFSEMVCLAESLAKGFTFIRVDLYNINTQIYFSELTAYPGGISAPFNWDVYDHEFGKKWRLQ